MLMLTEACPEKCRQESLRKSAQMSVAAASLLADMTECSHGRRRRQLRAGVSPYEDHAH